MNEWVKRSIKFTSEKYYLDNLSNVYPPDTDSFRHLELGKITNLRNVNDNGTNAALLEEILKTMKKEDLLSPVKDVYLGSLKEGGNEFLLNNPKTVSRIVDMIHDLYDFDEMIKKMRDPKEVNRKMGPMFTNFIKKNYQIKSEKEFRASTNGICVLEGSDTSRKLFAEEELDYNIDKGLDIIAKVNTKYVIGEAKFLTDHGGHQNDQMKDAMKLLDNYSSSKAVAIGILDGVVWIPSGKVIHRLVCGQKKPCLSALLLDEFFDSLK